VIEGSFNEGFNSIPRSIYWSIVTLTTVGYGDITPTSPMGQFLATVLMITGYAIIAVPTGIITSEMVRGRGKAVSSQVCKYCSTEGHDQDAKFCKHCGHELN
jgi:voltage-gated potassium channel